MFKAAGPVFVRLVSFVIWSQYGENKGLEIGHDSI